MRRPVVWRALLAGVFAATSCADEGGMTPGLSGGASASGSASASATSATPTTDDAGSDGDDSGDGGSEGDGDATASSPGDDAPGTTGDATDDGNAADETTSAVDDGSSGNATEAETTTGGDDELADGILDVTIIAHDDCTFTVDPPLIAVPAGTAFTVNWISDGGSDTEFDVAKIDQFNAVPIILGLEPGGSYHDDIREWCGDLFDGTFDFELRSCFDPTYIPVDCSAD